MNKHAAPPEFAMSFTHEAVFLEQREGRDWRPLGRAFFAGRELAAKLTALRDDAGGGAGDPDTVLVIPDDQILYTTLTVPVGADTTTVIARALEGMTPYAANELAFDWCPAENGDVETLRIAAVARRTLEEAEDFARAQGFQPSGFTARPGDDRFMGDPDFGPSRLSEEQVNRSPFSEPDLSQARITDPVIADIPVAAEVTAASVPQVPETAQPEPAQEIVPLEELVEEIVAAEAVPQPEVVAKPELNEPTVSRIVSHHVVVPTPAAPAAVAAAPVVEDVAEPVVDETEEDTLAQAEVEAEVEAEAARADHARLGGVIRHGHGKAAPAGTLSPRAQAVHTRATEARAKRAAAAEPEEVVAASMLSRLSHYRPGRLGMMIGGLAIAVVLVLTFFGGGSDPQQVAATDDGAASAPVETTTVDDTAQVATDTDVATTQPAPVTDTVAPDAAATDAPLPDSTQPQTDMAATDTTVPAQPSEALPTETLPTGQAPVEAATAAATQAGVTPVAPLPRPQHQQQAAVQPGTTTPPAAAPVGNDTLSRALTEALAARDAQRAQAQAEAAAANTVSAATMAGDLATAPTATQPAANGAQQAARSTGTASQPRAAQPAAAGNQQRLASSARPRAAPTRAQTPQRADVQPVVPANPQPYAQRSQPQQPRVAGNRPQSRPSDLTRASAPASTPAAAPAAATPAPAAAPAAAPATSAPSTSSRPPSRPDRQTMLEEGSRAEEAEPTRLTADERLFLENILRDLRTAQAGNSGLSAAERDAVIRLADARPQRRPMAVNSVSENAVRDAVASAMTESDRPAPRADHDTAAAAPAASAPAASSGNSRLSQSARPSARPGGARQVASNGAGNASLSRDAVESAIASAVADSPASPGGVALTALNSSALPPRRAAGIGANAVALAATSAPAATPLPQSDDAAIAEQRRMDDELQRQAEERARQRAAADAQAEAQARANAEARARAQAEAEARAAAQRQQTYTPPEAEDEPEVASANIPDGRTPTTAGNAATVQGGIQVNRTQIIGTIGAGRASRALIRLSNGRVLTLRIGDKINGGTISEIGDSKITYVRGGQPQQLSVLGGR